MHATTSKGMPPGEQNPFCSRGRDPTEARQVYSKATNLIEATPLHLNKK
jgi:hypothetical protein